MLCHQLGVLNAVLMPGFIDQSLRLDESPLVIGPIVSMGGFALVLVEALASGCPV